MRVDTLHFDADAAIIARLGQELVAKQETALIELVKNAYDAEATRVRVTFSDAVDTSLEISDDGVGMTRDQLINGFLRLASDLKVAEPVSPIFHRRRAGRKGIGRFATQRLGDRLILETRSRSDETGYRLTVDWSKFRRGTRLDDVDVTLEETFQPVPGTRLKILGLRDSWTDAQVRQAWRGLLALQQPFPVAPVQNRPDVDPGFNVEILKRGGIFGDDTLISDLKSEVLDHLHAVVELEVDDKGLARWRITQNKLGEDKDWRFTDGTNRELTVPRPLSVLRSVWMKAHYVVLDPSLLSKFIYTRLRDLLSQEGGVRLYRNGFRVVPYGEPDNDWLGLDATYARRSVLSPIANRNFFGVVEVRDPDGQMFDEHTSREGLIENDALIELKRVVSSVLISAAQHIASQRGRKPRAGTQKNWPKSPLSDVQAILRVVSDSAKEVLSATTGRAEQAALEQAATATSNAANAAAQLIADTEAEFRRARESLADEAAMLRFLASIGMTVAEFSHETGMSFDAFRLDFSRVIEEASVSKGDDPKFMEQVSRASSALQRLDTLTSYLNALASARSARSLEPQSLRRTVELFERGVSEQAKSEGVELVIETPNYDPLMTRPMHSSEIASVLLNFYTNSVKALKRANGRRRIRVIADRVQDAEEYVRIRFQDTGDGIPEANRERIFEPFFTTSAAPSSDRDDAEFAKGTGLGLWIAAQVADNAGGDIRVGPAEDGFATSLELYLPAELED